MLLATDLDGTFLGGRQSDRMRLYRFLPRQPEVTLVFVTGRGFEHVLPLIYDPTIPTPKYVICDVGTTIVQGDTLEPVQPIPVPYQHLTRRTNKRCKFSRLPESVKKKNTSLLSY